MPTSDASEPRAAAEAAHLTFFLGDEEYGVPLARVAEIAPDEGLTRVPGTPGLLRGVVSVRGAAVAVVDLARKFGLKHTGSSRRESLVVVETPLGGSSGLMALVADRISRVAHIPLEEIEPVPALSSGIRAEFLRGMARTDRGYVLLLDLPSVLNATEQQALSGELASLEVAAATTDGPAGTASATSPSAPAAARGEGAARRFVIAKAGSLRCGLDAESVQEVTVGGELTVVPGSASAFRGLFNLRGTVVPVVDLAAALGQPGLAPGTRTAFLVVNPRGDERGVAALAVHSLSGMAEVGPHEIESLPEFASPAPGLVEGTAIANGGPVLILDLKALLSAPAVAGA
ncbi:MAG TPA: chemotaxis protein CheW [Vicinamibacteria bacterium]|jgi:purine-binding chemotaxis protein CheW